MFVKDAEDHTIIKSGESVSDSGGSEHWSVKSAADKQAAFLNAQSRAMSTLNNLIKQYEDMKPEGEAELRIKKLKAELKDSDKDNGGLPPIILEVDEP